MTTMSATTHLNACPSAVPASADGDSALTLLAAGSGMSEVAAAGSSPALDTAQQEPPLVTAVLVCWNHERFLRAAVLSVLNQSYRNIELIVFDNGSTDGSRRELQALEREFGFKLVLQENVGLVRALNRGLLMAQGKYFAVLATDDIWLPRKTEIQVDFMEREQEVQLVFGAIEFIDENGVAVSPVSRRGSFVGDVSFEMIMTVPKSTNGPTVMLRTETLRAMGGYDERFLVEDFPTVAKFTRNGYRVVGLPDALTKYRRHGNNWSSRPLFDDKIAVGHMFRDSPEYKGFVRIYLKGYFRWLAGHRKRDAIRLLFTEPLHWSMDDIGVGLIKLVLPKDARSWIRSALHRERVVARR